MAPKWPDVYSEDMPFYLFISISYKILLTYEKGLTLALDGHFPPGPCR